MELIAATPRSKEKREKNVCPVGGVKTAQFPYDNNVTLFCSGRARAQAPRMGPEPAAMFSKMAAPM